MSDLPELLTLMADRVHLAAQWIDRGKPEQARLVLDSIRDDLLELARETDR